MRKRNRRVTKSSPFSVVISYALHRKGEGAPKSAARGEPAEDLSPPLLTQIRGSDKVANGCSGWVGPRRPSHPDAWESEGLASGGLDALPAERPERVRAGSGWVLGVDRHAEVLERKGAPVDDDPVEVRDVEGVEARVRVVGVTKARGRVRTSTGLGQAGCVVDERIVGASTPTLRGGPVTRWWRTRYRSAVTSVARVTWVSSPHDCRVGGHRDGLGVLADGVEPRPEARPLPAEEPELVIQASAICARDLAAFHATILRASR